ncbi:MAG: histidinol dehydrogenase [Gaiellaceae bacterium]
MRGGDLGAILPRVLEIVHDVRDRGDAALLDWAERLDGERPAALRVPAEEIARARIEEAQLEALRESIRAVREFHAQQRPEGFRYATYPGVEAERRFLPIASVGVYVPGGKTPLPSSLVMGAAPARVAGVERVVVATPKPAAAVLVAARELGIEEVYCMGGAQAIAALAFGTESVRRVDKIVGPGQSWTTAAKMLVSHVVGVDLPAGPSEVLVIADGSADPRLCAADLLAQAEHGPGSEALLVTTSEPLAERVRELVGELEQVLIEIAPTLEAAIERANDYAPEHLELMVSDPEAALARVRNAGAVFLGPYAPAVAGDYAVGTNHVLPTGGLARACGALGLEHFLKPVEIVRIDAGGLARLRPVVTTLARLEGLPRHAAAVEERFVPTLP